MKQYAAISQENIAAPWTTVETLSGADKSPATQHGESRLQSYQREGWRVIASAIHCRSDTRYPTYHFILERDTS